MESALVWLCAIWERETCALKCSMPLVRSTIGVILVGSIEAPPNCLRSRGCSSALKSRKGCKKILSIEIVFVFRLSSVWSC